jgi:osmotically-inducible protein OsmY
MRTPKDPLAAVVQEELDWNPALNATRIEVDAEGGRIILRGAVLTLADVELAGMDAWAVRGVRAVDNELQVGLAGVVVDDGHIAGQCTHALDVERFVPNGAITARVVDGWVTLTGEVDRHYQRRAAARVVAGVTGVLGITNMITLSAEPVPSDVATRIKKAMARKAIIDGCRIEVSNVGPLVSLDGDAWTRAAIEVAVDTAWSAPGVAEVVNRLTVASGANEPAGTNQSD